MDEETGIPAFASLHDYDTRAASDRTALHTGTETLVQQQFGEEVDINTIVRRFGLTKSMPSGVAGGVYGDFTGISDYQSAIEAIERAQDGFMVLPPEVRQRFDNDPAKVIQFAQSVSEADFVTMFESVVDKVVPGVPDIPPVVVPVPPAPGS